MFYDTDAQSPCATIKDVAVKKIKSQSIGAIMVWDGDESVTMSRRLTFNGETLKAHDIVANSIKGSAAGITDLPTDKFMGQINASYINHGSGLRNIRGELQINPGAGIQIEEDSVSINLQPNSGLATKNGKVILNPVLLPNINTQGQNLADNDVLMVGDRSRKDTRNTTLKNLYDNYFKLKIPQAAGSKQEIQFKSDSGFESSENLIFDNKNNLLNIEGNVKAHDVISKLSLRCNGAVYKNITKISQKEYDVESEDHTIICNTSKNAVKINLPPPQNNEGRILIIKKIDDNKHKITSNPLKVACEDGRIDIGKEIKINMSYSTRTLQCDGENWWILGGKGS